jgi:uncharacterized membrane protein
VVQLAKSKKSGTQDHIERRGNGSIVATRQEVSLERSGPLPSPEELAGYDQVLPGAAERILQTFEKQVEHRHFLERSAVLSGIQARSWGLGLGFFISIAGLGVSLALGLSGHEVAAGIVAAIDLTALAGVFVFGSQAQRSERREKREEQK